MVQMIQNVTSKEAEGKTCFQSMKSVLPRYLSIFFVTLGLDRKRPILSPPKSIRRTFYNLFNVLLMLFGGERMGLLRSSPKVTKKIDWVSGACMMVNKNIFDKVGGFDINIFMYVEDMEFCYRLGKMGYDTYFYSNVSVSHKEQGSSNRTFAVVNIYEGIAYFYKKHKSAIEYQVVKFFLFLKALTVYILGKLTNNSYYTKTYGEVLRRVL